MRSSLQTETVQFTTKGRIVIPARIRRELRIEGGTKAAVTITPEGILLRPVPRSSIKSLRGSLRLPLILVITQESCLGSIQQRLALFKPRRERAHLLRAEFFHGGFDFDDRVHANYHVDSPSIGNPEG